MASSENLTLRPAKPKELESIDYLLGEKGSIKIERGSFSTELKGEFLELFLVFTRAIQTGNPFSMIPINSFLTTQQAANILNVSRPFVVKEIERGNLSASKVNRHRRIALEDFALYHKAFKTKQNKALQELSSLGLDE